MRSPTAVSWLALLLLLFLGGATRAEPVDCGKIGFAYEPADRGAEIVCMRSRDYETSGASATFEEMIVDHDAGTIHIVEGRAGNKSFFHRGTLRKYIELFAELRDIGEWTGDAEFGEFEVAPFSARMSTRR